MHSIRSNLGEQSQDAWGKPVGVSAGISGLCDRYKEVRALSEQLAKPLSPEDQTVQSMPDASPTKWHLAHTSWFFETFILEEYLPDYRHFHSDYRTLFNSYYNQVGEQYSRPHRGLITRPGAQEVLNYRHYVDEQMHLLLSRLSDSSASRVAELLILGLNHEQQHQELLLTDIKHAFSFNPLYPEYVQMGGSNASESDLTWESFDAGIYSIGFDGEGFHFDNESPSHRAYLENFTIASRPVTNGEYLAFIQDRGYQNPNLWLSEGWSWIQENGITSPLYWHQIDGEWMNYTLAGLRAVSAAEPVIHISYYEADAFARWAGARLPTEQEWEVAAVGGSVDEGRYLDPERCHPEAAKSGYFGDVWAWTSSAYNAYPGFKTAKGAVGEYNGKFMCNQFVLRGGSCVTPKGHIRPTYRNFFPASARWQFSGLRLAKDA